MTTRVSAAQVHSALKAKDVKEALHAWPRALAAVPRFEAVVVLNDWGPTRQLVELAKQRGSPSFAKVEGVQDFNDQDTAKTRHPYRHASIILGQGKNDQDALPSSNVHIVGSSYLEGIWRAHERQAWNNEPIAVLNSNFTFGVLANMRLPWLHQALDACRAAGLTPLISQHPAEARLPNDLPVTTTPMRELLAESADVLISRFSTVPFEAMARGVPFVYFRPPPETVPTFQVETSAYGVADHARALSHALGRALTWRGSYRRRAAPFFLRQVDVSEDPPGVRAANAILSNISR